LRESTAEVLRAVNLSVQVAEDGANALEVLRRFRPSVILLDLLMPRLDGVSFVEAVDTRMQVIVVSSHELSGRDLGRLDGRVIGYLKKPVVPTTLIESVLDVLGLPVPTERDGLTDTGLLGRPPTAQAPMEKGTHRSGALRLKQKRDHRP
jgi:CheY-like chemotaxis protein